MNFEIHLHRSFSGSRNNSIFSLLHRFFSFFVCPEMKSVSVLGLESANTGRSPRALKPCRGPINKVCDYLQKWNRKSCMVSKHILTCTNWMGSSVSESWLSLSSLFLSSDTSRSSCPTRMLVQSTPDFSASPTLSLITECFLSTERTKVQMCSAHSRSRSSHASHAASW